jgi:hypothetical protein
MRDLGRVKRKKERVKRKKERERRKRGDKSSTKT